MGTVSSALLAHLSGICISGQVTEALLRGQLREESWRQPGMMHCLWSCCLLRPAWSLDCTASAALRGKGLCVSVWGWQGEGLGWRAELDPSEQMGLLSSASHSPQHEKHGYFSGSFSSAPWFTSILLHSCPCQEKHDFGQGCSVISGGTKSVSPALLGGTELLLAATSNNGSATDTVTAAF